MNAQVINTTENTESDRNLERHLIGSLLLNPSIIDKIAFELSGFEFDQTNFYGELFDLLVSAHQSGRFIQDKSLVHALIENVPDGSMLSAAKDPIFIHNLFKEAFPGNWGFMVARIKQLNLLRTMETIGFQLKTKASDRRSNPNDLKEWLESEIGRIGMMQKSKPKKAFDVAKRVIAELKTNTRGERGVMTGFRAYDEMIGPLMGGELITLAARPGMGKTAMAMQIAKHNFMKDRPVLFISLEMTADELIGRAVASIAGVNGRAIRTGKILDDELVKLEHASWGLEGSPLTIYDPPQRGTTSSVIRAMCKQEMATSGIALLIVDYIGIVDSPAQAKGYRKDRHQEVAEITASLKSLAKELRIPVLALCQLTREADKGRPTLSSLAESASIERDSDVVLFLWREQQYRPETEWVVAKHRHSDVGTIPLNWVKERVEFVDPSTGSEWKY